MTKRIFARLLKSDGKYHYGLWAQPAPLAGPLFEISIAGEGVLPASPHTIATPEEHNLWIASVKAAGFDVNVIEVMEPDSASS